ncbi:MAG: class I SAM-dependent methyltransferase [Arenicellales bacterium]
MYYLLTKAGRFLEMQQVKLMMKYGLKSYQPDPFGFVTSAADIDRDPEGTHKKWLLIKEELPAEPYTALDLGCNIGYFSFLMALNKADHVVGMELERGPVLVAEKLKTLGRVGNVGFLNATITDKNVDLLGEYDVILFLSVFHHLVHSGGMDAAKYVLSALINKSRNALYFETGQGDQGFGKMAGSMPKIAKEDALDYCTDLLMECGAGSIQLLGETSLKNSASRLLFKAKKRQE